MMLSDDFARSEIRYLYPYFYIVAKGHYCFNIWYAINYVFNSLINKDFMGLELKV